MGLLQPWPPPTNLFPTAFPLLYSSLCPSFCSLPSPHSFSAAYTISTTLLYHSAVGSRHPSRCASAQWNKPPGFSPRPECRRAAGRINESGRGKREHSRVRCTPLNTNPTHHRWEDFFKTKPITPNTRKPPWASHMSDYVPNVMGLFYFTLMQNQRFHYSTETNILKGHEKVAWDMQDVMYWRTGSFPL